MASVIDIRSAGLQFRGAPVTLMSEGVEALFRRCGQSVETGIGLILRTATDVEPSGCILQSSAVGGVTVWVERFGCTFEDGRHEGAFPLRIQGHMHHWQHDSLWCCLSSPVFPARDKRHTSGCIC